MKKTSKASQVSFSVLPKHIALIIDGNGRWAKEKNKSRSYGHKIGAETLEKVVTFAKEIGIKIVSIYAFSTENWKREKKEVEYLFSLFSKSCTRFLKEDKFDNGIRFLHMGKKEGLPKELADNLALLEEKTKHNSDFIINVGLNYGARDEILRAVNKAIKNGKTLESEKEFANLLDTHLLPDPELLIRTSGEQRLSNFMLYQLAYSEFYFPKTYWPDFKEEDLIEALKSFENRNRRHGKA